MLLELTEIESAARQQELMSELTTLRDQREADIQHAIGQTVVQYREQLESSTDYTTGSEIESISNRSTDCRNKSVPWKFL